MGKIIEDTPTDNSSKTVASEYERCPSNVLEWDSGNKIYPGEYVKYNGQLYRCISNEEINWGHAHQLPPGTINSQKYWKKISEDFDEYSTYFKGDIVKDTDGKYYQLLTENTTTTHHPSLVPAVWKLIDIDDVSITTPSCRTSWL